MAESFLLQCLVQFGMNKEVFGKCAMGCGAIARKIKRVSVTLFKKEKAMNKSLIYASLLMIAGCGSQLVEASSCGGYKTDAILKNAVEINQGVDILLEEAFSIESKAEFISSNITDIIEPELFSIESKAEVISSKLDVCSVLPVPDDGRIIAEGSYCLQAGFEDSTITITASNVTLDLNGNEAGLININDSSDATVQSDVVIKNGFVKQIISIGEPTNVSQNIQIVDVIVGEDTVSTFSWVNGLLLKDCTFSNGVSVYRSSNIDVIDCLIKNNTGIPPVSGAGILFDASSAIRMQGCSIKGFFVGVGFTAGCITANVVECEASVCPGAGFSVGGDSQDINIRQCTAKKNGTGSGFLVGGTSTGLIKECVAEDSAVGFLGSSGNMIFVANFAARNTANYLTLGAKSPVPVNVNTVPPYWANVWVDHA